MSIWTARGGIAAVNGGSGVASYNGTTLLVDLAANVYSSVDGGVTWGLLTTIAGADPSTSNLIAANGTWVWGGFGVDPLQAQRSTDGGVTWASIPVSIFGGNGATPVTDGAGHWSMLANETGSGDNVAFSNDDGLTWGNQQAISDAGGFQGTSDGTFFLYGGEVVGSLISTTNGIAWIVSANSPAATGFSSIGYSSAGPSYVAALSASNAVRTANIPSTLTIAADITIPGLDSGGIFVAFFAASMFVVFDGVGGVADSTDGGTTWNVGTLNFPPGDLCVQVTYDSINQNFIALSSGGYISTLFAAAGSTVPNVLGSTLAGATEAIVNAGLIICSITGIVDSSVPIGSVVSQSPPAGSSVAPGSCVTLVISVPNTDFDVLTTVISQYQNSPVLLQLVQNMSTYLSQQVNFASFYAYVWNVLTAVGFGLDTWGVIVGVSRLLNVSGTTVSLDDDNYRTLILVKALANITATTAPALNQLLTNLFGSSGRVYVTDPGGMEMNIVFEFPLTPTQLAILTESGAVPHPAGVQINIINVIPGDTFGFNGSGLQPFNQGVFWA